MQCKGIVGGGASEARCNPKAHVDNDTWALLKKTVLDPMGPYVKIAREALGHTNDRPTWAQLPKFVSVLVGIDTKDMMNHIILDPPPETKPPPRIRQDNTNTNEESRQQSWELAAAVGLKEHWLRHEKKHDVEGAGHWGESSINFSHVPGTLWENSEAYNDDCVRLVEQLRKTQPANPGDAVEKQLREAEERRFDGHQWLTEEQYNRQEDHIAVNTKWKDLTQSPSLEKCRNDVIAALERPSPCLPQNLPPQIISDKDGPSTQLMNAYIMMANATPPRTKAWNATPPRVKAELALTLLFVVSLGALSISKVNKIHKSDVARLRRLQEENRVCEVVNVQEKAAMSQTAKVSEKTPKSEAAHAAKAKVKNKLKNTQKEVLKHTTSKQQGKWWKAGR